MIPISFSVNYRNCGLANPKPQSKGGLCGIANSQEPSYFAHFGFGKFRIAVVLSTIVGASRSCPVFTPHISHIVGVRPYKKMLVIDAGWNVTAMQYQKPARYWSVRDFPCHPMGTKHATFLIADYSIAEKIGDPLPNYAAVGVRWGQVALKKNYNGDMLAFTHGDSPKTWSLCQSLARVTPRSRLAYLTSKCGWFNRECRRPHQQRGAAERLNN